MSQKLIQFSDFQIICRLCLMTESGTGGLNNIYLEESEVLTTCQLVTNIEMDDSLPKNVCRNCVGKLKEFATFIAMCKLSREILSTAATTKIKDEVVLEEEITIKVEDDIEGISEVVNTQQQLLEVGCFGDQYNYNKSHTNHIHQRTLGEGTHLVDEHGYSKSQNRIIKPKVQPKIFACNCCRSNFAALAQLEAHVKNQACVKPHKCETCGQRFAIRQSLRKHQWTHVTDKAYKCTKCDFSAYTNSRLAQHMRTHEQQTEHNSTTRYLCMYCGKSMKKKYDFVVHLRSHTDTRPFKCGICEKRFRQRRTLRKHLLSHEKVSCDICEKMCSKGHLQAHMRVHLTRNPKFDEETNRSHACEYCDKSFNSKSFLMQHLLVHAPKDKGQTFACNICGKEVVSLRKHIYTHFYKPLYKKIKCDICKVTCNDNTALGRHKKVHDGIHKCVVCNINFSRMRYLKVHQAKIHSNVHDDLADPTPRCSICQKVFPYRTHLVRHLATHAVNRERPLLVQKKLLCPYCGVMKTSSNLKVHIRIHTGEKPYKCQYCDKTFAARNSLNDHENIHNGIRPYECYSCKKTFTQNGSIKKHLKSMTCSKL